MRVLSKKASNDASEIILGKRYRDLVHGVEGVAVSKHTFLTGCDRVTLEWLRGGEIKCETFDITQLEPAEIGASVTNTKVSVGGPQKMPAGKGLGR